MTLSLLDALLNHPTPMRKWEPLPESKVKVDPKQVDPKKPRGRIKAVLPTRPRRTPAQAMKDHRDARFATCRKHILAGLSRKLSLREIASGTQFTHYAVYRYIRSHAELLAVYRKNLGMTAEDVFRANREKVYQMLAAKRTIREIAKALTISAPTTCKYITADLELSQLARARGEKRGGSRK